MNSSVERFRWGGSEPKGNGTFFAKEDSASKLVTDEDSDVGDTVLCKSSIKKTSFIFEGVRFSPKVIEFIDAFEGKQFSVKITLQNVGKKPARVKIGEPNSFIFQLKKPSRRTKLLASGSSLTKVITYSYHNDDLVQRSQIPVQINGRCIDYPIIVTKAIPEIAVEPNQLDYKQINLGASAKSLMLTIHNSGGKRTKFEIDLGKNDLELVVSPIRGTVKAKSKVNVVVEMMGMVEGEYFKELWVTTSEMSTRVPVIVEVVKPRLEIIHPNVTEDFVLIDFKPTFVNTQRAETFLLKNYSADTTLFIALGEIGGNLQFMKDARKIHQTCKIFMLTAEEGRLEPFESRVITVLFRPKECNPQDGWHAPENQKKINPQLEHILFIRMTRVHCIEIKELDNTQKSPTLNTIRQRSTSLVPSSTSQQIAGNAYLRTQYMSEIMKINPAMGKSSGFLSNPSLQEKFLRVCLHGTSVEPKVAVQPVSLEFQPINVGQTDNKVIRITNQSILPVMYQCCKMMNVSVTPCKGWLQPNQAFEFLITLTPSSSGVFKTNIRIEILGKSDVVFENDKELIVLQEICVPVCYEAKLIPKKFQPKLGLGLTPLSVNEVGFMKDLVTFKSDCNKPKAAMLSSLTKAMKPNWMTKEPDKVRNVDNAIIAFPNDRPRNYYTWDKDNVCRTIFKGFYRYSPPADADYALSPEEKKFKEEHNLFWTNYIKTLRDKRQQQSVKKKKRLEEEVSCNRREMKSLNFNLKHSSAIDIGDRLNKFIRMKDGYPKHNLVPLSPQYLNNINVEPKIINFGSVAINSIVKETLTIYNMNPFPIGLVFIPGKTAVNVLERHSTVILPLVTKSVSISFQAKDLGRHYGFLNYVINGSHQFKITISADVTSKTLMLEDKNMVIEFGNYAPEIAFQPRSTFLELGNLLQSPIKYHWYLPAESSFSTDIVEGEVPPKTQLLTEIKLIMKPGKSLYSELDLVSESGSSELIKLIYPNRNVSVSFLDSRIELYDVPLNLPTVASPVLHNACYHDVTFEVLNWDPFPGVIVEPRKGVLKPRSFFPLNVNIQINVLMKFSFDIVVLIYQSQRVSVKISGTVVLPVIRVKPSEVIMRKICPQSFDSVTFCIENAGTTPAEIDIDLEGCPEYTVADNKSHIYLPPSKFSKLKVNFQPMNVARYIFYLPIIINKILGPPMLQQPQTETVGHYLYSFEKLYEGHGKIFRTENTKIKLPCVCINSTVSPALLALSTLNVNFQALECPVLSEDKVQAVTISNDFTQAVTFCFRTDDLGEVNDSPFDLVPVSNTFVEVRSRSVKATLRLGEKLILNAKFRPKVPGTYKASVPIFVKDYNNGAAFNYITLTGELKEPKLISDTKEIHFSPLPLEISCQAKIMIFAKNYYTCDTISCHIWNCLEGAEARSKCLSVKWIQEPKVIPRTKVQTFQVEITFRSDYSAAVRDYLVFIDSTGNYCTVLVTAIADNSAVTTHAFLSTRTSMYKLVKEIPTVKKGEYSTLNKKDIKFSNVFYDGSSKMIQEFPDKDDRGTRRYPMAPEIATKLIIQIAKSMSIPTQLSFVKLMKNSLCDESICCSSAVVASGKKRIVNSIVSQSDNYSNVPSNDYVSKEPESGNDVTHPNFPTEPTCYGIHFQKTLAYVERWIYEVVMRCDQYFSIPESFQKVRKGENSKEKPSGKHPPKVKTATNKGAGEKDILDFLEELFGCTVTATLPQRPFAEEDDRVLKLYGFFDSILQFLNSQGCLLPHVKPEYLMNYEDYSYFVTHYDTPDIFAGVQNSEREKKRLMILSKELLSSGIKENVVKEDVMSSSSIFMSPHYWRRSFVESLKMESEDKLDGEEDDDDRADEAERQEIRWLTIEGKKFVFKEEILDKSALEARSTQAWLDIIIQIFRTFVLSKLNFLTTIAETEKVAANERILVKTIFVKSDTQNDTHQTSSYSKESNVYSIQEQGLLLWLNYYYNEQKELFCGKANSPANPKSINNFDKDLADSIVLIFVTAAHCPYIVPEYLTDIFLIPDTQNKMYHNASKLALVWKILNIGITVESVDLVNPNPVFMLMLIAHLKKVLPSLHPHYKLTFDAPLSSESVNTIQIKNENDVAVIYQVKLIGEYEGYYRMNTSNPTIAVKANSTTELKVIFTARKIKKVSATLILCGNIISPNFARHLSFSLEGEPSGFQECTKMSFTTPIYKVLCTEIPVTSPYAEPTTYEIWYTATKPVYKDNVDTNYGLKPWSKIWNRKVCRRLFLNKCEITINPGEKTVNLGLTVACLTEEERNFWLLFRSPQIGDFLLMVNIKATVKVPFPVITAIMPRPQAASSPSSDCFCNHGDKTAATATAGEIRSSCPLITELSIPARNDLLWESTKKMFLKTLYDQEKSFWSKHFEMNIGLCLILWFISIEEEESVADEFAHILKTQVTYTLEISPSEQKYLTIPAKIEIPDVRQHTEIKIPIHVSPNAPSKLKTVLTMTSENGKEIRRFKVVFTAPELSNQATFVNLPEKPPPPMNETCRGKINEPCTHMDQ